jgi:hypothetical protein
MKKQIILLAGKAQSGKNTVANIISKYRKSTVQCAFAQAVKDGARQDFNDLINIVNLFCPPEYVTTFDNWYENKNPITRSLLQIYGTNIFRDRVDSDYWVKYLKNRIKTSKDSFFVITDVRFPNEIECFKNDKDFDTLVVKINRNTCEKMSHISEKALDNYDKYDIILNNSGSKLELEDKICKIFNLRKEK